jgi:hypothetical protein
MIETIGDIEYTAEYTDEDWRAELKKFDDLDLLILWSRLGSYNPATWNSADRNEKSLETYRHARHCMLGEILERMGK